MPALAAAILWAIATQGCGESAPPNLTPEEFKQAKEKRETIIQKEYGSKAFAKGNAPKKKAAKR